MWMSLVGITGRCGLLLAAFALMASSPGLAADYDQAYAEPRAAGRPFLLDPRCRIIPQPELNLYGDTARFRPTMICMSRGLFADSFGPYPFHYPYYDR
jgi:hypothetical protein